MQNIGIYAVLKNELSVAGLKGRDVLNVNSPVTSCAPCYC